jgi:uncharacterized protein
MRCTELVRVPSLRYFTPRVLQGISILWERAMIDEATINEAGRRLLDAAPAGTRVILFGSHARGEAGRHSDLDLLVIEPNVQNAAEESVRLRRTLRGLLHAADVIVASEQRAAATGRTQAFFQKPWPDYERRGLGIRELAGNSVVIPVWLDVTQADVARFSPRLADKYAARSA